MLADIVYPVRDGERNDKLRLSLRSLEAHYPTHGQVWVVGYQPSWLINVAHIPGNEGKTEGSNVYRNILTAMLDPDVAPNLIVMNDDFFITAPMAEIPVLYRGTLKEHLKLNSVASRANSRWAQSLRTTELMLQTLGFAKPLSYELHVPLPVDKQAMADTLSRFVHIMPDTPPQWRSLYGNINDIGGEQFPDCKVSGATAVKTPFHSVSETSWRHYKMKFEQRWPEPSRYEKPQ